MLHIYVVLDAISALLTLVVAAFFVRTWRRSEDALHLLFAVGFGLVGASFASATASEFDLGANLAAIDAVRLAGQLGGALVLAFAYVSRHVHGEARPWLVVGGAVAALSVTVAAAFWLVPPLGAAPPSRTAFTAAHALMVPAYAACVAFAFRGYMGHPAPDRLLVPLAFLAWGLTKYTWLLVDVTGATGAIPFIYAWRFAAIGLLLAAVALPARGGERPAAS